MSSGTPAMCLLCQTAQAGSDVSLFTARRAGEAGRSGNTVGTHVCADLTCAVRARSEIPPWLRERDPQEVAAERTAELEQRVHGFLDAVLR
jgi:treble-clef zinc-finger protein